MLGLSENKNKAIDSEFFDSLMSIRDSSTTKVLKKQEEGDVTLPL